MSKTAIEIVGKECHLYFGNEVSENGSSIHDQLCWVKERNPTMLSQSWIVFISDGISSALRWSWTYSTPKGDRF